VTQIMTMGFERDQVLKALRAAFIIRIVRSSTC